MIATAVLVVGAVVGVGFWSSRPQYTTLVDRLSPHEVAEIMSQLQEQGIPCRENLAATSVQVPRSQLSKARMAVAGSLGPAGGANIPEPDGYFVGDPALRRYQLRRHQEELLAQSISQMDGVQRARVTISKPEPSPFLRDTQPTRASVMLDLRRGVVFSQEQAASIVMMMAHSVEGLEPERVSLVDTAGNQLASMRSPADTLLSDQYRYARQLESDLSARAEWLLSRYLGPGNALVRVTADVDFRKSSLESLTYDPELRAKRSERIYTKSGTQVRHRELGPAGTASNVGSTAINGGEQPFSDREQMEEIEYENARILETVKEAPVTIRRLTVAAVVDLERPSEEFRMVQAGAAGRGDPMGGSEPPDVQISQDDIERILKQAVGFDDTRGDQIAVLVGRLAESSFLGLPPSSIGTPWDWYRELLRNASLGIASIVALILGLLVMGRMRPVLMPTGPGDTAQRERERERSRRIGTLSDRAMQDPDRLAKLLQVWLGDRDEVDASAVDSSPAAAEGAKRSGRIAA